MLPLGSRPRVATPRVPGVATGRPIDKEGEEDARCGPPRYLGPVVASTASDGDRAGSRRGAGLRDTTGGSPHSKIPVVGAPTRGYQLGTRRDAGAAGHSRPGGCQYYRVLVVGGVTPQAGGEMRPAPGRCSAPAAFNSVRPRQMPPGPGPPPPAAIPRAPRHSPRPRR